MTANVEKFAAIYQRALDRKGGEAQLHALLGKPKSSAELLAYTDADWLDALTKKIFQSGFVWRVVENKWSGFREVFFDFVPEKMVLMSDEMLAAKATDARIIRNATKVFTIRDNAQFILDMARQHGSFAAMVANWPTHDIIGLWALLKKHGQRLGGNTGPFALRAMGKDTFLFSRDVEAYLRAYQIVEGSSIHGLSNLKRVQAQFNQWQEQSGWSLQQLSRLIAFSCGDNHVGLSGVGQADSATADEEMA